MTVCERIDSILKARNMSRRKLAIEAGIPPSSFQSAMQRNKELSMDMLMPISQVLEVDPFFLLDGIESLPTPDPHMLEVSKMLEEWSYYFFKLNFLGQKTALERIKELTEIPKYTVSREWVSLDELDEDNPKEK